MTTLELETILFHVEHSEYKEIEAILSACAKRLHHFEQYFEKDCVVLPTIFKTAKSRAEGSAEVLKILPF